MRPPAFLAPSRFGVGALVVAALALGQVLNERLPDGSDSFRPHEAEVAVGGTVSIRTGDVTPTAVEGARTVLRDVSPSIRAQGVGLVVRFDFVSRREATALTYAQLRGGDGTLVDVTVSGQRSRLACPAGPPGLVVHCTAVVEVDPAALPGASLVVGPNAVDERFDEVAVIDLGVDANDVERWMATEQVEVVESEVDGL